MHMSNRARNAEGEVRKGRDRVFEHDMSLQILNDARRIVVLLLALSHLTEGVNLLLGGRAGETCRVDSEVSLQVHSLNEVSLPRRNQDFYPEVHRSGQRRAIRVREEV